MVTIIIFGDILCSYLLDYILKLFFICRIEQFKQAFTFIRPDCSSVIGLLDTLKVADTILFMVSAESGFDRDVDLLMTCILAQGLPSTVVAITDLDKIPLKVRI